MKGGFRVCGWKLGLFSAALFFSLGMPAYALKTDYLKAYDVCVQQTQTGFEKDNQNLPADFKQKLLAKIAGTAEKVCLGVKTECEKDLKGPACQSLISTYLGEEPVAQAIRVDSELWEFKLGQQIFSGEPIEFFVHGLYPAKPLILMAQVKAGDTMVVKLYDHNRKLVATKEAGWKEGACGNQSNQKNPLIIETGIEGEAVDNLGYFSIETKLCP